MGAQWTSHEVSVHCLVHQLHCRMVPGLEVLGEVADGGVLLASQRYDAAAICFRSLGVKWTRLLGLQFQMDWVGRVAALS